MARFDRWQVRDTCNNTLDPTGAHGNAWCCPWFSPVVALLGEAFLVEAVFVISKDVEALCMIRTGINKACLMPHGSLYLRSVTTRLGNCPTLPPGDTLTCVIAILVHANDVEAVLVKAVPANSDLHV